MLRAQLDTVPDKQGAHCPLAASQQPAFHSVPHFHKTFVKERKEIMFPGPAQTKFWETPELIAKLLTFLDLPSTLRLAKCHQLTQDVIQGSWVWNKLIRRFCPHDQEDEDHAGYLAQETVRHFVAILKLMRSPNTLLLDLLDLICERFEANRVFSESFVYLSCTCQPEEECHAVTLSGFLL